MSIRKNAFKYSIKDDLSINKYKEVVYEQVEYEPTEVIVGKIEQIESEIQAELAELKKLLGLK